MTGTQSSRAREQESSATGYEHLTPMFDELAALPEDDPRRGELRNELVTGHLPLAEHIAARFANRGVPREDLVQVATLGLINAVDRFQPDRGTDFLSFAVAELSQRLGRAPTPSELGKQLGLSPEQVYEGLEAGNAYHSMSLDEALSPEADSDPLGDTLGQTDESIEGVENYESLRPLIEALPDRERQILTLRFFRHMTQTQIAERIGISQMHVSRLLSRTLENLRKGLLSDPEV